MTYTEEEAREKWCPMARMVHDSPGGPPAYNRMLSDATETSCIASDCMMWVVVEKGGDYPQVGLRCRHCDRYAIGESSNCDRNPDNTLHEFVTEEVRVEATGRCGLAK